MTPARSQKAHFRLLLFSDLMLDRPYEWAPPAVADARRTAAREALVKILGAARAHHVDVIACAGDLFDRRTVAPSTMQWLIAALRSATTPVLIAPGNGDFVGPLGGYSRHQWSDNVTVFDTDRFTAVDVSEGVTVWGAAHTEAHRARAFFDRFEVDRDGVNLALFHGAERSGVEREPGMEPCAPFDESAVEAAGFDHALVGHYQQAHFGWMHTYSGAPIAHELGNGVSGAAVLVTLADDGTIERELIELSSPALHDVEVDLTGAKSARDAVKRAGTHLAECSGIVRLRLTGRVVPDIVLQRDDFVRLVPSADELLLDWEAEVDVDLDELAEEQTVRGQFVRDVLASRSLSDERQQRVLLTGLRALAGSDVLEGPR
jgi:DNA repair exonuclease SbcCD nuclease subunit